MKGTADQAAKLRGKRPVDDLPAGVTDLRVSRVLTYRKVGVELR